MTNYFVGTIVDASGTPIDITSNKNPISIGISGPIPANCKPVIKGNSFFYLNLPKSPAPYTVTIGCADKPLINEPYSFTVNRDTPPYTHTFKSIDSQPWWRKPTFASIAIICRNLPADFLTASLTVATIAPAPAPLSLSISIVDNALEPLVWITGIPIGAAYEFDLSAPGVDVLPISGAATDDSLVVYDVAFVQT